MAFGVLTTNSVEEALARAGDGPSQQGMGGRGRGDRDGDGRRAADASGDARRTTWRVVKKDPRHRAREAALQMLYQWDIGQRRRRRAAETFFDAAVAGRRAAAGRRCARSRSALARDTVAASRRDRRADRRDRASAGGPSGWRSLDRLILRMAVCELLRDADTPPAVVINEALELARTFSTEER